MRVTFPNPFGPPISLDTKYLSGSYDRHGNGGESSSSGGLSPDPSGGGGGGSSRGGSWRSLIFGGSGRRGHSRMALIVLVLLSVLVWRPRPPFPPSYRAERLLERESVERAKLENGGKGLGRGKTGRYVRFDMPKETGFNHQLQRQLLYHHMAVLGNRSLAYEPIVHDVTRLPFKIDEWPWHSARIPLSAFVTNVISGFEQFYDVPTPVPAGYYDKMCSRSNTRTYTLRTQDNDPSVSKKPADLVLPSQGQDRIHQLQVLLAGSDDECIRIRGEVFDDDFFNSKGPVELYEHFIRSPVIQHFTFSPKVLDILNGVLPRLAPDSMLYDIDRARTASDMPYKTSHWKHILALHLRKGLNWAQVCDEKAARSAPFVSFNQLPRHPGNENVPPPPGTNEPTRLGLYRAKCNPELLDIIARARRMRKNHPLLRSVYVMTDDDDGFGSEVAGWLASEGWDHVWVGSRDVYPDWDDREVGVAVDMEVARRAGVFVGNGFSMTASNIVLLRSRDGLHPDLTQFW